MDKQYAVVVPVYNSAAVLLQLWKELKNALNALNINWEVIFVNDASQDKSWEVLQGIKTQNNSKIKLFHLDKNHGQHAATLYGIMQVQNKYIITIDDDLQYHPRDIQKLIACQQQNNSDLVYGMSDNNRLSSYLFKWLVNVIDNRKWEGSSFRLINPFLAAALRQQNNDFIFLEAIFPKYAAKIDVVKVIRYKSLNESRYTTYKRLILAVKILIHYSTFATRLRDASAYNIKSS